MFSQLSQFRQAVESLAHPQPQSHPDSSSNSVDLTEDATGSSTAPIPNSNLNTEHQRTRSLDAPSFPLSLSQLPDSPLSSFRKWSNGSPTPSLGASQRSTSPASIASPASPQRRRPNLEERLRAVTHSIGSDSPNASTSSLDLTGRGSPAPRPRTPMPTTVGITQHPLSPTSTPLPNSPTFRPTSPSHSLSSARGESSALQSSTSITSLTLSDSSNASTSSFGPSDNANPEVIKVEGSTPLAKTDAEFSDPLLKPDSAAGAVCDDKAISDPILKSTLSEKPEKEEEARGNEDETRNEDTSQAEMDPLHDMDLEGEDGKDGINYEGSSVRAEEETKVEDETKVDEKAKADAESSVPQTAESARELGNGDARDTIEPSEPQAEPAPGAEDQPGPGPEPEAEALSIVLPQNQPTESASTSEEQPAPVPEPTVPEPMTQEAPPAEAEPEGPSVEDNEPAAEVSEANVAENTGEPDIEALRERLKLVEQRFADVSTSFKRLQAEKMAADRILKELTPVESVQDADGLRDFLQNLDMKTELSQEEIKRLTANISRQEERLEELRDTHRLESKSQVDLIDQLRKQIEESEALLKVSQTSASRAESESASRGAEIDSLRAEVEKQKLFAREAEEKSEKAVSLLKTVRQKLVKAEKDRDNAIKEVGVSQGREKEGKEKEEREKEKLRKEMEEANAERERAIAGLRSHFDRDIGLLKDRHERELMQLRKELEAEAMASKTAFEEEISRRDTKIASLERSAQSLVNEKDTLFDQLQMRQAEVESVNSHLEVLQNQNGEYQYQIREANDRNALFTEELADLRRLQEMLPQGPSTSAEEVARLLATAGAKYEAKLADARRMLTVAEKERDEAEAEWSRKFKDKAREMEGLKRILDDSAKSTQEKDGVEERLRKEVEVLKEDIERYKVQMEDIKRKNERASEIEDAARRREEESKVRMSVLEKQIEEIKSRESQLRLSNKTLRDELRKVQSSAALLERQRNPGVGYWGSRADSAAESRRSTSSLSDSVSRNGSRPSSPTSIKDEEEVNLEYLRNVVLQFLEHEKMRPQLVRVLSTILHFTPQETRRLVAKV